MTVIALCVGCGGNNLSISKYSHMKQPNVLFMTEERRKRSVCVCVFGKWKQESLWLCFFCGVWWHGQYIIIIVVLPKWHLFYVYWLTIDIYMQCNGCNGGNEHDDMSVYCVSCDSGREASLLHPSSSIDTNVSNAWWCVKPQQWQAFFPLGWCYSVFRLTLPGWRQKHDNEAFPLLPVLCLSYLTCALDCQGEASCLTPQADPWRHDDDDETSPAHVFSPPQPGMTVTLVDSHDFCVCHVSHDTLLKFEWERLAWK